jgi:hypothetical protein
MLIYESVLKPVNARIQDSPEERQKKWDALNSFSSSTADQIVERDFLEQKVSYRSHPNPLTEHTALNMDTRDSDD